jgi:hypothetical protein
VRNVPGKFVKKIKTHFMRKNYFLKIMSFMALRKKMLYSRTDHAWQYDAALKTRDLHVGQL